VNDPTARLNSALNGRYRIERELGAGGMATVYLAEDIRHGRPVAVKVLRPELAAIIGPDRFLAEIRTTANLQHAHILGLIDSGEADGTVFYVMPFVDGESLRQRLARQTQLPIPEAVRIATDVAGALDYAHRRGVIHRDIKPENILLHEGQPLVADFGIALAVTRSGDGTRITESGMSLGTPQYMSPEQASGERNLDARTDVYALGCVLYEMLTGEPPFSGPSARAVIAKVMTVEPEPVTTLRRSVPANVAAAVMTALQKVPADRFASAADFAAALNNPLYVPPSVASDRAVRAARGLPSIRETAGLVVIGLLAIVAAVGWLRGGSSTNGAVVAARFEIAVPDSIYSPNVTLSPDGKRLLWSTQTGFYERRLDSLGIHRLRDATAALGIRAVSPDGNSVLLGGRGGLAVAALSGGVPRPIITAGGRGAWARDGTIFFVFADQQTGTGGIGSARADGTRVDTLVKTKAFIFDIVPVANGRGLIVTLLKNGTTELDVLDVGKRQLRKLDIAGSLFQFVEPGYLLFARGAAIMVAPFDEDKLTLAGTPVSIADVPSGGISSLSARANTLVYLPLPEQTGSGVVIRSRIGTLRSLANIPDTLRYSGFALSPDAQRLAVAGAPPQLPGGPPSVSNLYIYELATARLTRLRADQRDASPAWFPNGRDLSFVRVTTDTPITSTLMRRAWDGSTAPSALLTVPGGARGGGGGGGGVLGPVAWFPDGRHAVLRVAGKQVAGVGRGPISGDLMRLSLDAPTKLDTVVATEYAEGNPALSPDGRTLAFTSNESGTGEVYIRPVEGGALRRVSLAGGNLPRWAHSGRELFYTNFDTLFAADIRTGAELGAGEVHTVFVSRNVGQGYAALPGDTSFVTSAVPATNVFVVVTNLTSELARMFPKK
jgi:eukaryotic-like serine/threonine-protein kinase